MQAHAIKESEPTFRSRARAAQPARHEEIGGGQGGTDHQPLLKGLAALSVIASAAATPAPKRRARNRFLFHRPIRRTLEQLLVERACVLPYPIGPAPARARRLVKLPVIGLGQQADKSALDTFGKPLDAKTVAAIQAAHPRPQTRGECAEGIRPCPYVSCRHHLMLDVHPTSGAIKLNFRTLEEMTDTCSLDVADRDRPLTLKEIGEEMGVTNERVRQIEVDARSTFAAKLAKLASARLPPEPR